MILAFVIAVFATPAILAVAFCRSAARGDRMHRRAFDEYDARRAVRVQHTVTAEPKGRP